MTHREATAGSSATWGLIGLTFLFASSLGTPALATPQDGGEFPCTAFFEKSNAPGFQSFSAQAGPTDNGFDFGTTHTLLNATIPEPIPLTLGCQDNDTVYMKCLDDCVQGSLPGYWTADWSLVLAGSSSPDPIGPDQLGAFVGKNGERLTHIPDAQNAVYLPPRDLMPGESRDILVQAEIWDPVKDPGLKDTPATVVFHVLVYRNAATGPTYFNVLTTPYLPTPSDIQVEPCDDADPGCCTFIGETKFTGMPITAMVLAKPDGMLVGDTRPIILEAEDQDQVIFECGQLPCPGVWANEVFFDGVNYTWNVVQGDVSIISDGSSAVIQAGQTPGFVKIQVTVDDASGFGADDQSITVDIEFYVHEFRFIDQANQPLEKLNILQPQQPPANYAGLQVSRLVTDLAGSGNDFLGAGPAPGLPITPTFDGPVSFVVPPDPNTYRFEGTRAGAPAAWPIEVQVTTERVWTAANYENAQAYDVTFPVIEQGGAFRSDKHLRLVSNKAPVNGVNPLDPGVYDDQVCGDQTILALPGDWVTGRLIVNNKVVGKIELPVERPWGEANLPYGGIQPIRESKLNWYSMADGLGAVVWDVADFHAQRMTEDYAPAGMRMKKNVAQYGLDQPENALFLPTQLVPNLQAGTITFDMSVPNGPNQPITVNVAGTDTFADLADAIVAQIDAKPGFDAFHHHNQTLLNDHPFMIVVNKGQDVSFSNLSMGTTQAKLKKAPLNYTDQLVLIPELEVFAMNFKPVLGAAQDTVDVIVDQTAAVLFAGQYGLTVTTDSYALPVNLWHASAHTTCLAWFCGDGHEWHFPAVFSHEMLHFYTDIANPIHDVTGAGHLLSNVDGHPTTTPPGNPREDTMNLRRLTDVEINKSISEGGPFVTLPPIKIPEKK